MTLPMRNYSRDPLDVLIAKESRTCKGCKWFVEYTVFSEQKNVCERNRKKRNDKCFEEKQGRFYCNGGK